MHISVTSLPSQILNFVHILTLFHYSLTGSGSVTVESVQRHSSGRLGHSDDGHTDFSLTAIDLPALRLHLSGVIASNKDRWKELSVHGVNTKIHVQIEASLETMVNDVSMFQFLKCFCLLCTELANKEQEEQEGAATDNQSHASPNRTAPGDQSQNCDGPLTEETQEEESADHNPEDHLTWNGKKTQHQICVLNCSLNVGLWLSFQGRDPMKKRKRKRRRKCLKTPEEELNGHSI